MIFALLLSLLAAAPLCPAPHRSRSVIDQFVKEYREAHEGRACPLWCATFKLDKHGHFKLYRECGACQVDHVCALACGGVDAADNLQYLSSEANRKKSDDCSACREPFYGECGTRR